MNPVDLPDVSGECGVRACVPCRAVRGELRHLISDFFLGGGSTGHEPAPFLLSVNADSPDSETHVGELSHAGVSVLQYSLAACRDAQLGHPLLVETPPPPAA